MDNLPESQKITIKYTLVLLLGVTLTYLLVNGLVSKQLQEIELNARVQIANQQTVLSAIAETTARNGADAVTESIIKDCTITERSTFENLLGRLDQGLSKAQLVELERLFGRCGGFFSQRKSLMVARLAREIEVYEDFVEQLGVITGDEGIADSFSVAKWQMLAAEETKQSELFAQLVRLQDQIIANLLEGKSASSPEITEILQQVNEVRETLLVANKQASNIRSELISL